LRPASKSNEAQVCRKVWKLTVDRFRVLPLLSVAST
jgi:hypothetical protein